MKKNFRKKSKSKKWILGIALGFVLYLLGCLIVPPLVGTQKECTAQLEIPAAATEQVCLIDSNEQALNWRLRLIQSAQKEIILSTFDFRADNSGTDILAALLNAAERGVQVRLIIDGINAQLHLSGSDVFQALAAHEKVEVKYYNPIRLTHLWTVNYRCHDKYLIIDRQTYLMGGRNTNDLFLGNREKLRQNMDRDVVVHGDGSASASVNTLLKYFEDIWNLDTNRAFHAKAEKKKVKDASTALAARWESINQSEQFAPIDWAAETIPANGVTVLSGDCTAWNKKPLLLNTLTALMQEGEKNIVLQTPYIICNGTMYDALKKANAAASVQIITNAPQSGANPWGCADYLNHRKEILASGSSVCEWSGDLSMHTKTILIDDQISLIGSFNWDIRSAYLDTEMMLLIDSPELNAMLREQTGEMIRQSKTVLPDGTTIEGDAYALPEVSALKKGLQAILRVLIRPFRYVL